MTLDGLVQAEVVSFLLETVRISGVVIAAPLAWVVAPLRVRVALVLLLAMAAHGPFAAQTERDLYQLLAGVGSEFVFGLGIGFVVRLAVAVAEIAADQIAPLMGIGILQVFDPQSHAMQNQLATLFRNLMVLLGLIVGLHRVVIGAVLASFRVVPPGSIVDPSLGVPVLLQLTVQAMATGVRIAIPLIAILALTQAALAFVSRAAPAMQVFSVGFAVTMATGALVLVLVLPDTAQELLNEASRVAERIESFVSLVQAGS